MGIEEQLCFFPEAGQSEVLLPEMLEYIPGLFSTEESDVLMRNFISETPWKQRKQKMWDKEVLTPRPTAWHGERMEEKHIPWTRELLMIKEKVEAIAGVTFNSVLLNYHRDGNNWVTWHSDKENILGKHPVIASVTLGQVRSFDIRRKTNHKEIYFVRLEHNPCIKKPKCIVMVSGPIERIVDGTVNVKFQ